MSQIRTDKDIWKSLVSPAVWRTSSQIWVHGRKCSGWMFSAWCACFLSQQHGTGGVLLPWEKAVGLKHLCMFVYNSKAPTPALCWVMLPSPVLPSPVKII